MGFTAPQLPPLSRSPLLIPARAAGDPRLHALAVALAVGSALGFPLSPPELRALAGAEASRGPSRERSGSGEAGLGTGRGVPWLTSRWVLSQDLQCCGFFCSHTSLGSCRSPQCQSFHFSILFGEGVGILFQIRVGQRLRSEKEKRGQRKSGR